MGGLGKVNCLGAPQFSMANGTNPRLPCPQDIKSGGLRQPLAGGTDLGGDSRGSWVGPAPSAACTACLPGPQGLKRTSRLQENLSNGVRAEEKGKMIVNSTRGILP